MATKKDVNGISVKRKKPIVIPVDTDPENQWISKAEFLKKRKAQQDAKAAGEEARLKVLADRGVRTVAPAAPVKSANDEKIESLRKALANAESKLSEKPGSKVWAKKVKEISDELEVAESEE